MLIRLLVISGTFSSARSRPVTSANAARGTIVAIVGTGDSCQQKCVLIRSAPAASIARPSDTTSSQASPPSSMSIAEIRNTRMNSRPTASRTRRTTSTAKRIRFSHEPPQRSVRRLVLRTRKVLIR